MKTFVFAIKEKFKDRKSFDDRAKYDPKTISDTLYFNTGELLMKMTSKQ